MKAENSLVVDDSYPLIIIKVKTTYKNMIIHTTPLCFINKLQSKVKEKMFWKRKVCLKEMHMEVLKCRGEHLHRRILLNTSSLKISVYITI